MSKSPLARRADLDAALKRLKKNDTILLAELALLWGVTKARFVNVRNEIADFPAPIGKQGNADIYQARPAVEALVRYERRHDRLHAAKSSKVARILGASPANDEDAPLPASEMLALARTSAEIQKRKLEQGELVRFSDVQQVASEVFGEISATLSKLSDVVDPNGKMPAAVRATIDGAGSDLLLRLYAKLTDMLGGNADSAAHPVASTREGPDRPRRTQVRKGSAKRVRRRA